MVRRFCYFLAYKCSLGPSHFVSSKNLLACWRSSGYSTFHH